MEVVRLERLQSVLGLSCAREQKMKKTITDAVITANRRNASKSTGPRTAAGKSVVAKNAIRHGLLSRALGFQREEDRAEYLELLHNLEQDFNPQSKLEGMLVEEIAVCWWKLQSNLRQQMRALGSYRKLSSALLDAFTSSSEELDPLSQRHEQLKKVANVAWDFREVTLRVGDNKFEEEKGLWEDNTEKKSRVGFEAKLGNSGDSFLRYERAWKRDLFRAITMLKMLQSDRFLGNKGSR